MDILLEALRTTGQPLTMQALPRGLGILFLHHELNQAVLNNLRSVRRCNPRATIVTMSAAKELPGGYSLQATPEIKDLHAMQPTRSGDWLVCSWFLQRRERCRKWWIIDWDVFCAMSVRKYYRPVWDFPFVASSVRLPFREPEWRWFKEVKNLPAELRPYAMGAVPSLFLLSERALSRICCTLLKYTTVAGNAELRFCTAANFCGYPPCGYSPPGDQINWKVDPGIRQAPGIFHPVKTIHPALGTQDR